MFSFLAKFGSFFTNFNTIKLSKYIFYVLIILGISFGIFFVYKSVSGKIDNLQKKVQQKELQIENLKTKLNTKKYEISVLKQDLEICELKASLQFNEEKPVDTSKEGYLIF